MDTILNIIVSMQEKIIYSLCIIIWTSILQKFHYDMLFFLRDQSIFIIRWWFNIITRIWVILHEFSHLIFVIIFGWKVHEIKLFSKRGGHIKYSVPDYIWSLGHTSMWLFFWIKLIVNRIWIFMVAIWPLIVWILITMWLAYRLFEIPFLTTQFHINLNQLNIQNSIIFILYLSIFLPSFILSFQDISNLLVYRWDNIFATIIGSIFNIIIFTIFLVWIAYLYDYLYYFFWLYVISFAVTAIVYLISQIINLIFRL